jgi:hypothetical protein
MASSVFHESLAMSRDETSGNNLDIDQLNMIDPHADADAGFGQVSRRDPTSIQVCISLGLHSRCRMLHVLLAAPNHMMIHQKIVMVMDNT